MSHNIKNPLRSLPETVAILSGFLFKEDGMGKHFCNEPCKYNDNLDQICEVSLAYHVGRNCVTFRKRAHKDNYRDLMRSDKPVYHKEKVSSANITNLIK